MRGRLWLLGAAAIATIGQAAPEAARADAGRPAVVSLGDSFISGEGGRWLGNGAGLLGTRSGTDRAAFGCGGPLGCRYDPRRVYGGSEDNGCHRSDVAPIRAAAPAGHVAVNLACSGARLRNLWPAAAGGERLRGEAPQVDRLAAVARRFSPRLVVVAAGANDAGFGRVVAGCALDWARSSPAAPRHCGARAQARIEAALPALRSGLTRALRQARRALGAAGHRHRDHRLLVMAYASPFPPGGRLRYPEDGWSRLRHGRCPVWDADASWAADRAIPSLAAAMRGAARAAGAEFLDLRRALDGHQLCDRRASRVRAEGPDPATAEWVRQLGFAPGSSRESLHPNAYGQRAIGACIALHHARPPGDYACRATPGRGYEDGMRLEELR